MKPESHKQTSKKPKQPIGDDQRELADDLRDRLLSELEACGDSPQAGYRRLWRLIVQHPWYRRQLHLCAKRLLRGARQRQWLEDLKHEAMLLLADELQRCPDLNLSRAVTAGGWLRTILWRHCWQALQTLREQAAEFDEPLPGDLVAEVDDRWTELLDLQEVLETLEEDDHVLLALYAEGYTLRSISELMDCSYWQCRLRLRQALRKVRRWLAVGYRWDRDVANPPQKRNFFCNPPIFVPNSRREFHT